MLSAVAPRARLASLRALGEIAERRPWLLWLGAGLVFAFDAVWHLYDLPRELAAVLDASAHAFTALMLLGYRGVSNSRRIPVAAALGAVLIDLDHVPGELGYAFLTAGTNRPYSHSLAVLGGLGLVACLLPRRGRSIGLAVWFGIATHLLRDLATGGVPLWWPASPRRVAAPYALYAILLLVGVGLSVSRRRGRLTG